MALPFFYVENYESSVSGFELDEDTSRHIAQVLRMQAGELLHLTDGKGHLMTCEIITPHKKHCAVQVKEKVYKEPGTKKVSIAISLLKNTDRFEWFLEKATEIGVTEIIPLICVRTEKEKFRHDRLKGICISAMLQSQQCWLPVLQEPVLFEKCVKEKTGNLNKLIAHCEEGNKQSLAHFPLLVNFNTQILIGPEGDFTTAEIELALKNGYQPVSLGDTRLRAETAGVVAATLLCHI